MLQLVSALLPVVALIGLIYTMFRPHWAFVIVICMFPIEQLLQAYIPALTTYHTAVNLGIGSLAIMAIIARSTRGQRFGSAYGNPMWWTVVGLYALWAAGVLYSPSDEAIPTLISSAPYIILFVGLLPLLVLDLEDMNRILVGFLVLGTIVVVMIMINPNTVFHNGRMTIDMGVSGLIKQRSNPLVLATLGSQMAIIAVFVRPRNLSKLVTLIRIAAFITGVGIAIGSGSRGQVLAAAAIGIMCFPLARKLGNPKQFVLSGFVFLFLIGASYLVVKLFITDVNRDRWDAGQMFEDIALRWQMCQDLLSVYLSRPQNWLLGLGPGAFSYYSSIDAPYVHNVVVETFCEHGVVGGALFTFTCVLAVRSARSLWVLSRDDPGRRATTAVLLAICLFAFLQSLKQGSISFPAPFFWWLILSKLASHEQSVAEEAGEFDPIDDLEDYEYESYDEHEPAYG